MSTRTRRAPNPKKHHRLPSVILCRGVPIAHTALVTSVTSTGLRERKKEKTRLALEAAALELFERDGFEATTVEAIAAACDVSPRTFFRYFASKDEVLHAEADARLARLVARLLNRPPDEPPFEALRAAVIETARSSERGREAILKRFRVLDANPHLAGRALANQQRWETALVQALADRIDLEHPATEFDLRLIAGCSLVAMRAVIGVWMEDREGADLVALLEQAFDQLALGFDPERRTP
jgi:AcrR family transcriptional regulator